MEPILPITFINPEVLHQQNILNIESNPDLTVFDFDTFVTLVTPILRQLGLQINADLQYENQLLYPDLQSIIESITRRSISLSRDGTFLPFQYSTFVRNGQNAYRVDNRDIKCVQENLKVLSDKGQASFVVASTPKTLGSFSIQFVPVYVNGRWTTILSSLVFDKYAVINAEFTSEFSDTLLNFLNTSFIDSFYNVFDSQLTYLVNDGQMANELRLNGFTFVNTFLYPPML